MTIQAPAILELKTGPPMLIRAVWYVLVGWWLTGLVMGIAWFLAITIVGLPLTFYLVNRVPTILTLRPRREQYTLVTGADGITRHERIATEQSTWAIRLLYFVVIGWWLSLFWMIASYFLMVTIIGIPLGLMMVNRLPYVFSLHRGYA
jgi:uncharacterized membrane protein YccF (DUF307 family)